MVQFMLGDFLNDPVQYSQAEAIWRERWNAVLRELGQQDQWQTPWINTIANDGTPFRDGNPIFSAVCSARHLGVRVIQVEPEGDSSEFTSWIDTFAEGDPDAIKELVIDCVLSEATLREAETLIKGWIAQETRLESRRAS
jgi:hypothetical protein